MAETASAVFPQACGLPQAWAGEKTPQWFGLTPGFHRMTLDGGQVLLTLCVGDITSLLRQQEFTADSVYLHTGSLDRTAHIPSRIWMLKALARRCHRGTRLVADAGAANWRADLTQCGFEIELNPGGPLGNLLIGRFNPRWHIQRSRGPTRRPWCRRTTRPSI